MTLLPPTSLLLLLLLLIDWTVALPSMVELSVHGTWKATGIFVAGAGRMMGSAAVYCQWVELESDDDVDDGEKMNFHLGCCPERWVYLFHLFYYSIIDCLPKYKREVAGRRFSLLCRDRVHFYCSTGRTYASTPRAVLSSEYVLLLHHHMYTVLF